MRVGWSVNSELLTAPLVLASAVGVEAKAAVASDKRIHGDAAPRL